MHCTCYTTNCFYLREEGTKARRGTCLPEEALSPSLPPPSPSSLCRILASSNVLPGSSNITSFSLLLVLLLPLEEEEEEEEEEEGPTLPSPEIFVKLNSSFNLDMKFSPFPPSLSVSLNFCINPITLIFNCLFSNSKISFDLDKSNMIVSFTFDFFNSKFFLSSWKLSMRFRRALCLDSPAPGPEVNTKKKSKKSKRNPLCCCCCCCGVIWMNGGFI